MDCHIVRNTSAGCQFNAREHHRLHENAEARVRKPNLPPTGSRVQVGLIMRHLKFLKFTAYDRLEPEVVVYTVNVLKCHRMIAAHR
jgi:hypothetical protein